MKKRELKSLQSEIKGAADAARIYNPRIRASSGPERHGLRTEKSGIGYTARYLLLAYALLRNIPYSVLEGRCSNAPFPSRLHREALRFHPDVVLTDVERWLEPPAEEARAAE